MSGKLDQSLDEILNTRREGARRARGRGGRRAPNPARKSITTPVDGVKKNTRAAKPVAKPSVPNGSVAGHGESKIIVNNLVNLHIALGILDPYANNIPACRYRRAPDQGMLNDGPFEPWNFIADFSVNFERRGSFRSYMDWRSYWNT